MLNESRSAFVYGLPFVKQTTMIVTPLFFLASGDLLFSVIAGLAEHVIAHDSAT
jgi:hypothetical protein